LDLSGGPVAFTVTVVNLIDPIGFDELSDELRALLAPRVERLGYLGAFFQYAAHQPGALHGFITFTEQLKDTLGPELVEVVALTVAVNTGNKYERVQHEALALNCGTSPRDVRRILAGDLEEGPFSCAQIAAAGLARASLRSAGHGCEDELARLVEVTDPATAIGVLLLCSRYIAHATFANALALSPPIPSPLPEPDHA
jgi:alkylhydroperoxidase family enzyme